MKNKDVDEELFLVLCKKSDDHAWHGTRWWSHYDKKVHTDAYDATLGKTAKNKSKQKKQR